MPKCKGCGTEIIWVKTFKGKKMPLDAREESFYQIDPEREGITFLKGYRPHWATCPKAKDFKK